MKTREQALAEHTRLTEELKAKPISQVFTEEATRLVEDRGLGMNIQFAQSLRNELVRHFEAGHHRDCRTFLKIDYMKRDPNSIALGNILAISSNWVAKVNLDDFKPQQKTISQMFLDHASSLISEDMHGNAPQCQGVEQAELVSEFESRFFEVIKEDSMSDSFTAPDFQSMAKNAVQDVVSDLNNGAPVL